MTLAEELDRHRHRTVGRIAAPVLERQLTLLSDEIAKSKSQKPRRTCSPRHARYGTLASWVSSPLLGTVADAGLAAAPATMAMQATRPSSIFLKLLKSCSSPF